MSWQSSHTDKSGINKIVCPLRSMNVKKKLHTVAKHLIVRIIKKNPGLTDRYDVGFQMLVKRDSCKKNTCSDSFSAENVDFQWSATNTTWKTHQAAFSGKGEIVGASRYLSIYQEISTSSQLPTGRGYQGVNEVIWLMSFRWGNAYLFDLPHHHRIESNQHDHSVINPMVFQRICCDNNAIQKAAWG